MKLHPEAKELEVWKIRQNFKRWHIYLEQVTLQIIYHLESRWRSSHVLVYQGPLLSHLLGVAPSTFTTV